MDVYDYAMQLEKEGEALYREYADNAPEAGMKKVFVELADQERKHYDIFAQMRSVQKTNALDVAYLKNIKNIFSEWRQNINKFNFDIPQADVYKKALDIEQKSIDFYSEKAEEIQDSAQKEMLLKIADEENKHRTIIENIIEFMVKPKRWVEHAMFTKVGEEY